MLNACGMDSTEKFWRTSFLLRSFSPSFLPIVSCGVDDARGNVEFHSKKILTKTAAKMLIGAGTFPLLSP